MGDMDMVNATENVNQDNIGIAVGILFSSLLTVCRQLPPSIVCPTPKAAGGEAAVPLARRFAAAAVGTQ